MRYPQRIVCLTEETTETLYLLGQGDRIVGVSGYTVRPPEARQKPKVSAFINARFDKILALQPDLVLAFSDLQAELAAELVRRGLTVVTFNQRTVAEILQMIRMLGGLVGCQPQAETLADRLERYLDRIRREAARLPTRPRVFFEEWDEPLISGIRWVEELVGIAGGAPIFPELAGAALAKDRIVDPAEVARRDPEHRPPPEPPEPGPPPEPPDVGRELLVELVPRPAADVLERDRLLGVRNQEVGGGR
jgi:iron complex transport system substrate-binding protein